ncbi:MAG: DUF1667 domain-containing protein [Clostridia bacterium]|nr:DUF1667 domain-containing protein [Clostridia bacterium]
MEERKMICIMCPMGCELTVKKVGDDLQVSGNTCMRGVTFAKEEITNPKRVVTTLVKTSGGVKSCKTTKPIPKSLMFDCVKEIEKLKIDKVKFGQIIIKNVLGTDADVIVTSND